MAIEIASVDWAAARRATYLVKQSFRYEYPEPVRDLSHRLVVIPPERFGDQRRLRHQLSVEPNGVRSEDRKDRFGNMVVDVFAPRVSGAIEFAAEISVERHASEPNRLPDGWLADGYLLERRRSLGPTTASGGRRKSWRAPPSGACRWPAASTAGCINRCCLLYTSPSPRDLSTSRMPSSA